MHCYCILFALISRDFIPSIHDALGNDLGSSWCVERFFQQVVNLIVVFNLSCICINVGCCLRCGLTCAHLPILVEYVEVCSITRCYSEDPWRGMWIPARLMRSIFQWINELVDFSSCYLEIYGNRLVGLFPKFDPRGCWVVYRFFNSSLPWGSCKSGFWFDLVHSFHHGFHKFFELVIRRGSRLIVSYLICNWWR